MSLSRRAFVRTLGLGGAGALSTSFIIARGSEALAFGRDPLEALLTANASDVIIISSNENPRGPSPKALEALRTAATKDVGRYPRDAVRELVETIAGQFSARPENVVIATGSGGGLTAAVHAYTSPQRALVTASPSYASPEGAATRLGVPIKRLPVDSALRLDLDAMADAARGAGLVFLCNPNNPTSTAHTAADVASFVRRVKQASPDTAILLDEAYIDYVTAPGVVTGADLALEYPDVFVMRTFSKAYGMAGLRLGYALGQPATVRKINDAWGLGSVNQMTAVAAIAALNDHAHMEWERNENRRIRDFTMNAFREMGYSSSDSQTNFVFVNIGRPAAEFREGCAQHSVMVGRDFPPMEKTHARVSIGTMDEMQRAVGIFRQVLGVAPTAAAARRN